MPQYRGNFIEAKKPSRLPMPSDVSKAFLRLKLAEDTMSLPIKNLLATRGIKPSDDGLAHLEKKWKEYEDMKGGLKDATLDDYDIALKNIAGGDHHG